MDRAKAVGNFEKGSIKVLEACMSGVRGEGFVSILGVYPMNYDSFWVGQLFDKGFTFKAGQSPIHAIIDKSMKYAETMQVKYDHVITHCLSLDEVAKKYEIFDKKQDGCVIIVLDLWI
ncbi:hypothetical protein ACK1KB_01150 [Chryseobacterium sp. TY3]